MKILALEFSSARRSAAVLDGSGGAHEISAGSDAVRGLVMVEQALEASRLGRAEIECLVVGLGPGSYTGIRGAVALAQGWELGRGVRILGISSADAIAHEARAAGILGTVAVVIDAQRGEFYTAVYEVSSAGCKEMEPLRIVSREAVLQREAAGARLVGPEIERWFQSGAVIFPRAETLGRLAAGRTDFVAGENLVPIYLRETTFVKAAPPG
ncbi:MAG: tRNA (adenosine(37)-N6)-threonylcarbamoyltransferase complex dimerization subunit type 1 TsaB [Verrucomicrobiota bacterium]